VIFRGHRKPLIALIPAAPVPSNHAAAGSGTGSDDGVGFGLSTQVNGGGSGEDDPSGGPRSGNASLMAVTNASPAGTGGASGTAEVAGATPPDAIHHAGGRPETPIPGTTIPGKLSGTKSGGVEIWAGVVVVKLPGAGGISIAAGHPTQAAPTAIWATAFTPRCA
jgi:hypothetical protein